MAQTTTVTPHSTFDIRYAFLDEINGMSTELVKNVSLKELKQQFENEERNRDYAVLGLHYQVVDAVFIDKQKISIKSVKQMINNVFAPIAA